MYRFLRFVICVVLRLRTRYVKTSRWTSVEVTCDAYTSASQNTNYTRADQIASDTSNEP